MFTLYGGESHQDLEDRMVKTLTEIMEKEDHHVVLAVSHCGASSSFLHYVDPSEPKEMFKNCEILHFTYDNKKFEYIEKLTLNNE